MEGVYSAEYFTTEGWRDDADRERRNACAEWYYRKVNYDPVKYLRLFAGVRQDWFTGKVSHWEIGEERQMKDYGATTHKGGIIVTPISDYSLYGNVGTTFALPKGTTKYDAGVHDERDFFSGNLASKPSRSPGCYSAMPFSTTQRSAWPWLVVNG